MVAKVELLNPKMLAGLLALDVASHYTGYAFFKPIAKQNGSFIFYLKSYGIVKGKDKDFDMRCLEINSKVRNFILNHKPAELIMEFPTFQSGNRGTQASRQGDTLKLAFLCGKIACGWEFYVAEMMKIKAYLPLSKCITPQQWKGQTTKTITQHRCEKKYGLTLEKKIDDNWVDAVMMGDWFIEKSGHKVKVDHEWERADF